MQGSFASLDVDTPNTAADAPRPSPVQVRVPAPIVTIRVTAKTTGGLPVAQLGLLLVHNGRVVPPVAVRALAELQRRSSRTDERGEFLLAGMPVGHYEIFAYTSDEEADSLAADRRRVAALYSGYLAPGESVLDVAIEPRH
jgi:hypothetical protein